jgi:hypothetical protein
MLGLLAALLYAAGAYAWAQGAPEASHPLRPAAAVAPVYEGKPVMNGYSLDQFRDFIRTWHFVTVRYRKDTGEMRLTYANDKAWEALQAGGKHYPDGAVFAKIGIMTGEDPAFTSSVVPLGAKRYQLMVMDRKKHTSTDGWGYALFDGNGKTFEQDPLEQTAACHACHKLVPERGYVFSQPMRLEIGVPAADAPDVPGDRLTFVTRPVKGLPAKVRQRIAEQVSEVRVVEGDLAARLFQGTIDEIRPALAKEALGSGLPALLINAKGDRFSMAVAKREAPPCELPDGKDGVEMLTVYTIKPGPQEVYPIQMLSLVRGGGDAK